MARPVVGIIGNSYLLNDQYPVHAGGQMNTEAIAEVSIVVSAVWQTDSWHACSVTTTCETS